MASISRAAVYSGYVLTLLVIAYLLNQLDRYTLAIVTKPMAQEIHYGEEGCMDNPYSDPLNGSSGLSCNSTTQEECLHTVSRNETSLCSWNYTGFGFEYDVLAGPIFIVALTFMGILLGLTADQYNRKNMLAACVAVWSLMTVLSGTVTAYWQLAILRFILGAGEAGCSPFAISLIYDYFTEGARGAALGVYNWGIYFGYSLAYAFGNFITKANILGQKSQTRILNSEIGSLIIYLTIQNHFILGWRWAWYISGFPGVLVALLIILTLVEPKRRAGLKETADPDRQKEEEFQSSQEHVAVKWYHRLWTVLKELAKPTLILLFLGGAVRNAAGYLWSYYTQIYFESIGQTPEDIGTYMSWVPLVGGSIGVLLGGFISDRIVTRLGIRGRLIVLITSQVLAAPFVAGVLYLSPPWAYISLIPGGILGEIWVSVTLTVLTELVPAHIRTSSIAVYFFIISNIAGIATLLVSPLRGAFIGLGYDEVTALRDALYILYPGLYLLAALIFTVCLVVVTRDLHKLRQGWSPSRGNIPHPANCTLQLFSMMTM